MDLVDAEFDKRDGWVRFQARIPAIIGFGFVAGVTYLYGVLLLKGISTDTLLATLSLVIAADSLAFTLAFATESSGRFRQIRGDTCFKRLRTRVPDTLLLVALIRMRASLPVGVNLKSVYDRDKTAFSQESLVHRALTPL
jgi:hypothetical protein